MKKILSFVLAFVLMLSVCPMAAFASDDDTVKRYTVLVLDTSGTASFISDGETIYTADTAISYVKKASNKFLTDIGKAEGNNYVAIVSYKDTATVVSDFTEDTNSLKSSISKLSASSNVRDISSGLDKANQLLNNIQDGDNVKKNVVLFTTGMTNNGSYSYDGVYDKNTVGSQWLRSDTKVKLYAYANYAVSTAETLKKQASLYVIGLFQTMNDMPEEGKDIAQFFQLTASDLATSEDYFYSVNDPEKLEFTFGEVAENINNNGLKAITFNYNDDCATCYYDNNYFSNSAYTYNQSLGTMSLALAMSAMGVKDSVADDSVAYQNSYKNAKKLMMDIGMNENNIVPYGYETKPTTDSIAAIIGSMPITVNNSGYTLIAIAVRGGGYEQEWASNFTIGLYGRHTGFNEAKNGVYAYLQNYIESQNITGPVKFWITGYSRAAATSNLLSGQLDYDLSNEQYINSNITYGYDDIYAYCFETPAGAEKTLNDYGAAYYKNIFNILNSSDPVPYVAPSCWNFGRYGVNKYLPSAESDKSYSSEKNAMLQFYNALGAGEYVVDNFQMKKLNMEVEFKQTDIAAVGVSPLLVDGVSWIHDDTSNNYSQGVFLSKYVTYLAKDFVKNRETYLNTYQDEIREICSVVFGCTSKQSEILFNSIKEQAMSNYGALAWSYFYNVGARSVFFWNWGNAAEREDEALSIVSGWLKNAIEEAGITDYNEEMIDAAGKDLADLALALISNHPNYFTTALCNGSGIAAAHYPQLCYAWMSSMDENCSGSNFASFNNGCYRVVHINCDVDVEVVDEDGNTVASIVNEEPQSVENSSIISSIDEDGEKIIILPVDTAYGMKITARNDDHVNVTIAEYSASEGDFTRSVNYFDMPLLAGESLTGIIPAYSDEDIESGTPEGSETNYVINNPEGESVVYSADLKGEEATSAYYNVNAVSSDTNSGYVLGGGLYQYGNFAKVEAVEADDCEFVGWYVNDSLVSTDKTYRFCVTEDTSLTAVFKQTNVVINWNFDSSVSTSGTISILAAENGSISVSPMTATEGTEVTVTVTPDNGYVLDELTVKTADGEDIMLTKLSDTEYTYTQPSSNVTIAGSFKLSDSANPFVDVNKNDFYYDAVLWAVSNGITSGTDSTHFSPMNATTRAQLVTMLYRAAGSPEVTVSNKFTDVSADSYYAKAVVWAVENGITEGTSETTFSPDMKVTRAQAVTFLARFAGAEEDLGNTAFTDVSADSYYAGAVAWATENGITDGTSANTFSPDDECLRGQIVTFLYRYFAD